MTVIRRPGDHVKARKKTNSMIIYRMMIILFFVILFLFSIIPDEDDNNNVTNYNKDKVSLTIERTKRKVAMVKEMIQSKNLTTSLLSYKNRFLQRLSISSQHIHDVWDHKRMEIQKKLSNIHDSKIPIMRLRLLRNKHEIVGERIKEIRSGSTTIQEIIHGHDLSNHDEYADNKNEAMPYKEIISFLKSYIYTLHEIFIEKKHASYVDIWEAYHDLTVKTLYPWDRQYLHRMPRRRAIDDDSIFVSIVSFRDEHCLNTLLSLYDQAKYPENIYVGLVQQNCYGTNCRSGLLENYTFLHTLPDSDCYALFCETNIGKPLCDADQRILQTNNTNYYHQRRQKPLSNVPRIRVLQMNESEALGPYMARYFASKLWYGEQWYMQIDSHTKFIPSWDTVSLDMLKRAPSNKPVISHYPPDHNVTITATKAASRLCGPAFATSDMEEQIIRIEGSSYYERQQLDTPAFSAFVGAGYLIGHSNLLMDVPYDPFLPWIFMGEEIILSSRLWTAGYDIFSPITPVINHYYHRKQTPKFWESIHRTFTVGMHNLLQGLVLQRIKYLLQYPESARDMIPIKSILTAVEQYGMGTSRSLDEYLYIIGANMTTKTLAYTEWCEKGYPPPGFEEYEKLYPGTKCKTLDHSDTISKNKYVYMSQNQSTKTPTSTAT